MPVWLRVEVRHGHLQVQAGNLPVVLTTTSPSFLTGSASHDHVQLRVPSLEFQVGTQLYSRYQDADNTHQHP